MYQEIHLDGEVVVEIIDQEEAAIAPVTKLVKVYMQTMVGYYAVVVDIENQTVTVVPDIKGWNVIRESIPHPE